MCGRFQLDVEDDEIKDIIEDQYRLPGLEDLPFKMGEVFPTDTALVLRRENMAVTASAMFWGFPKWKGHDVIINARAETALLKPMFRKHLTSMPIAIPTSGFYEWKAGQNGVKTKYRFREPGRNVLYLAGFAGSFSTEDGRPSERFVILTREPDAYMATFHNRMPVIIRKDEIGEWLGGTLLGYFLEREPFELVGVAAGEGR